MLPKHVEIIRVISSWEIEEIRADHSLCEVRVMLSVSSPRASFDAINTFDGQEFCGEMEYKNGEWQHDTFKFE